MTVWKRALFIGVILLLGFNAAKLYTQAAPRNGESPCFAIRVLLNGKVIAGPEAVTFRTKQGTMEVTLKSGCFKVPPEIFKEQTVDVLFNLSKNSIRILEIDPGFLTGPWDVDLEDKHFGKEVLPLKHGRVKEACAVIFHVGDPETIMTESSCRSPLKP